MDKKKKPLQSEIKDREVPPVKDTVTDLQDILRKPTAVFGPAHPMEYADGGNPAVLDCLP